MQVKQKSLAVLIKEADHWVSLFVRLDAADDNGTVRCISCGEGIFWKEADCCHYKDRDNMATRYYLPNLAPGCQDCNRHDHYWHIEQWEVKMTEGQKSSLNRLSHSMMKYTRPELEELINLYKEKVSQLKKQKHL